MSVKTLVSWSAPALSTHPDNPSGPAAFVSVDLFKGFVHIGYRERYHTVIQNSWCSRACFSVACLKAFSSTGRLASGFPFTVCNSFQALPHPKSIRDGVVGFNLNPVLTLCLFDGSSEGIAGFLPSVRISLLLLESAALAFSSMRMLPVIHGFWLGCTDRHHHRSTY